MRQSAILAVLVAVLSHPNVQAADDGLPRPEIAKLTKPATALVEAVSSYGSGFCIHPSGLFITNEHVIRELPENGLVTLVLDAGLKTQQLLKARIVRRDKELDLALLRVEGEHKLPALVLGSDEGLAELSELIVFGFPFGTSLAKPGEYPTISVNAGHVSSLRRDANRELHRIQLDAMLNPGNSGGPVLDRNGKVVGVVVSGIRDAGINLAIPVSHVSRFLARPEFTFATPVIQFDRRHEPIEFKATAVALSAPSTSLELELILTNEGEVARRFEMKRASGAYSVKAVPFPDTKDARTLRLEIKYQDGSMSAAVEDHKFNVGKQSVQLSEVRRLRFDETTEVLLNSGKKLVGPLSDLDSLAVKLGGNSLSLKLAGAVEVGVFAIKKSNSVGCTIVARESGKEVGRHNVRLSLQGSADLKVDGKNDLQALEGKWTMDMMEVDGNAVVDPERRGALFDGKSYILTLDGKPQSSAKVILDYTQNPKAIDILWTSGSASGDTSLGIYRFTEDGSLEICWNQARGKGSDKRPKVFTTKVELGAGSVLCAYKRPEK